MKRGALLLTLTLFLLAPAFAHTVDYEITQADAVVVTVFLGDEAASYSEYEVTSPAGGEPVQIGRLDARGRVSFLPDLKGEWKVRVAADSQHGLHGVEVKVKVDESMTVTGTSSPPIARHTRLIVGISLLFGIFGLFSLLRSGGKLKPSDHA